MNRVAYFTFTLIALIDARVYERCELARELGALGVYPDDISTWVCIAYHESRFDTTAHNPHSGDHGLFQISELYWCGPGKACGIPCSMLRDEDITNDLECALQVHEEHTRLQGNGFLAWVVYPQHCKHNTKKYLVDCDTSVKTRPPVKQRVLTYNDNIYSNNETSYVDLYSNKNRVEDLLPPYLASVGSIFKGSYGKVLGASQGNVDWFNYKVDNIDDLKLPVLGKVPQLVSTTTTTIYIPPVKPWRTIETNQFRKKQPQDKETIRKEYLSTFMTSTPSTIPKLSLTTKIPEKFISTTVSPSIVMVTYPATISSTSLRPVTTSRPLIFSSTAYITPTISTTTARPSFTTNTFIPRTATTTSRLTKTTKSPWLITAIRTSPKPITFKPFSFTLKPITKQPLHSWYNFRSTSANTTPATRIFIQTYAQTSHPFTTTARKPEITSKIQKSSPTQSIFDLYLNPTKPPKLPMLKFISNSDARFNLKIFSGGTTTVAPQYRSTKAPTNEQTYYRRAGNY